MGKKKIMSNCMGCEYDVEIQKVVDGVRTYIFCSSKTGKKDLEGYKCYVKKIRKNTSQ